MAYTALSFLSVVIFAGVHLWANKAKKLQIISHSQFLSIGGGIAIAYVFIDLLPKLGESSSIIRQAFSDVLPFIEKHAFVMALAGFLLFFIVDRQPKRKNQIAWLSMCSYTLFNFLVGYAVAEKDNPEVRPLALFTFAMACHYFTNDYSLSQAHGEQYRRCERWILIVAMFLGWGIAQFFSLSEAAVALLSAFIGGGVIMYVIRHELPKENPNNLWAFIFAAVAYTAVLLGINR